MNKVQAQLSTKTLTNELFSLNPSSLITLFEINLQDIGFNQGVISSSEISTNKNVIFRFHNCVSLTSNSIFWQGNEYIAVPIQAEGFETSVRGSPATPRLTIAVSDDGISQLARLKDRLVEMGDIIGAKLTRIRTFASCLDAANFIDQIPPRNFYPDPNAEIPRDIYFIDRKSNENKNIITYELSSLFDLEGIKLPGRIVTQDNCTANYRGLGCLYEYDSRKTDIHEDGILPHSAPPVATNHDEPISTLITGVPFIDNGEYNKNQIYNKGHYVYLENRGIKYYFVSKIDGNNFAPPDSSKWIADECSKKCKGCKLRWQGIGNGSLPINSFISVNRFK